MKYIIVVFLAFLFSLPLILSMNDNSGYGEWFLVSEPDSILTLPADKVSIDVTVTIYHPVPAQTDSDPDIVASGLKINVRRAGDYRYVAVSRDLLERWGGPLSYGEWIRLDGAGELSGWYQVQDTMNARWTKRVDVLMSPGSPLAKYEGAQLVMDAP